MILLLLYSPTENNSRGVCPPSSRERIGAARRSFLHADTSPRSCSPHARFPRIRQITTVSGNQTHFLHNALMEKWTCDQHRRSNRRASTWWWPNEVPAPGFDLGSRPDEHLGLASLRWKSSSSRCAFQYRAISASGCKNSPCATISWRVISTRQACNCFGYEICGLEVKRLRAVAEAAALRSSKRVRK